MLSFVNKKILSYAIVFLNSHPKLKITVQNIICRFPRVKDRLKYMTLGVVARGSGVSLWQIILSDFKKWIVRRRLIQRFLSKILSITYFVERKLDKLVVYNTAQGRGSIRTTIKKDNMGILTLQTQKIYDDLKKAIVGK